MNKELKELEQEIENMRSELYSLLNNSEFTDPDVLTLSSRLDCLINEHQKKKSAL